MNAVRCFGTKLNAMIPVILLVVAVFQGQDTTSTLSRFVEATTAAMSRADFTPSTTSAAARLGMTSRFDDSSTAAARFGSWKKCRADDCVTSEAELLDALWLLTGMVVT